ncbi:hypothetical protein G4B88_012553 [Cannabis sativa]|uniref:RNase H type-1 domain-containing protein n=1 Tax=Cannabis sativa TaxID=3483 RepID=A0A7J6EPN4_CANSA|nr:hypothetical protein G4B88_012553 [Cannabis sativa]
MQLISKQDFPLFVGLIWHIWITRNSIFFDKSVVANNVEEFVFNYLHDYNEAQPKNLVDHSASATHHRNHPSQPIATEEIQEDTLALYVDATLDHNHGVTGIGFTFKIGLHQIVAFANLLLPSASTPIFAEGQALLHGISWCISSQMKPDFILFECVNLVSKVNGAWQDHSAISGLVSLIRLSFSNFPDASLKYLPRQFNTTAHSLAKEGIRSREDARGELL